MKNILYKKIIQEVGSPVFIYNQATLTSNIKKIKEAISKAGIINQISIYPTYFTNSNPYFFRLLDHMGFGVTIQSVEEWYQLDKFELSEMPIMVSPTALSDEDLNFFLEKNLSINLSTLEEIEYVLNQNKKVGIRLDVSQKQDQRSGIKICELQYVNSLCYKHENSIHTLHSYVGTNSNYNQIIEHVSRLFEIHIEFFSEIKRINIGGGFLFDYQASNSLNKHFPWNLFFSDLHEMINKYNINTNIEISLEPGRDIFADTGELILGVNRIVKRNNYNQIYTNGSFVLMPSAMTKNRQHQVKYINQNFIELNNREIKCEISGNTTLSQDFVIPGCVNGPNNLAKNDYVIIKDVGAYGASQHMEFLNKRPIPEVVVMDNEDINVITKRGNFTDKLRNSTLEKTIVLTRNGPVNKLETKTKFNQVRAI